MSADVGAASRPGARSREAWIIVCEDFHGAVGPIPTERLAVGLAAYASEIGGGTYRPVQLALAERGEGVITKTALTGERDPTRRRSLQNSQVASLQPVKFILNWGRRYSLWLLNFGLACCGIELIAASMSKHDFIRFGVIPLAHGPRQADLLIIAGTVTDKMVSPLKRVYEQMPERKYVISFGSCANVGGPYWDSYSVTKGVDQIIPVDVFVPGCAPRPEALLDGIIMLQHKIADEEIAAKWAG